MKISLTLFTDNAAYDDNPMPEIKTQFAMAVRVLEDLGLGEKIGPVPFAWPLVDTNGNKTGLLTVRD